MLIFTSHGTFPELTADGLISLDQRITLLPPNANTGTGFTTWPIYGTQNNHKKKRASGGGKVIVALSLWTDAN